MKTKRKPNTNLSTKRIYVMVPYSMSDDGVEAGDYDNQTLRLCSDCHASASKAAMAGFYCARMTTGRCDNC